LLTTNEQHAIVDARVQPVHHLHLVRAKHILNDNLVEKDEYADEHEWHDDLKHDTQPTTTCDVHTFHPHAHCMQEQSVDSGDNAYPELYEIRTARE
jgi:hypothetical protein